MLISSSARLNEKALDIAAARHQAILSNLANADTPGYKSRFVSFEEELEKATEGTTSLEGTVTHKRHFKIPGSGEPDPIKTSVLGPYAFNTNGNSVDVDYEMSLMAKNQLAYSVFAERVSGHYKKMNGLLRNLT
ncbi:flagellar basal body rod protein FlgB [Paenibacillus sp. UNC499MF]|uniref:flagellar basal body rod protein FlgB n=1 Tax=Paenibacillus sp. UNC499MF TaxID=1502751 RepID=UPI00089FDDA7|nr:flagellar basal body rod protein FlgB [Paenibacillus sp. UNC499MF]SEG75007.1 flagellar basal-body rod protein FlgB [Paenibacillus sp. UNC499MF]